ncbi:aminoglycoside phosphotransferase family protein [Motilibacter peucedani]|nr:phosphotransferase [Motilibacter peucedani]
MDADDFPPPRTVTLVLCDGAGRVLGSLPEFDVDLPWWMEVGPVVEQARSRHGLEVTVLRLLRAGTTGLRAGGPVTYLVEAADGVRAAAVCEPWSGTLDDSPARLPHARPGGPAADLRWADEVLAARGTRRTGPGQQVRTWNLSSLWRLPLADGTAWLKVVPPFLAHEGALLRWLERHGDHRIPLVLGADGARTLLADVPGDDQYAAVPPLLTDMLDLLVPVQAMAAAHVPDLLGLGLPDWRADALVPLVEDVVRRRRVELEDVAQRLDALVSGLPQRLAEVASCGIPDTLVHGDFHPGNVRGVPGRLVLLDWGDSGVGCPLLDRVAFLSRIPPHHRDLVRSRWDALWAEAVPGSDPTRAAELLEPVTALRQAVVYQRFLDGIEPSEHVYHEQDPAEWLRRAVG